MKRYKIDILGITEARWDGNGEVRLQSGEKIIYSGHTSLQNVHTHGVALMLSKDSQKSLISWAPHGRRIIDAFFKTEVKNINIRLILC